MANYRAGDVIRLTRNAIGMTQEQLCEEICSVETLSRIENNKQGIGKDVYERLMAKMERNPLRNYAICSSMDMRIAEEKQALEDAVAKHDYVEAERHLQELKPIISNTKYNMQYISRFEAVILYNNHSIDKVEMIRRLDEAIRITIPNYEFYMEENFIFPFTEQEILVLMSLANAYNPKEKGIESIKIFRRLLECIEYGYMDSHTVEKFKVVLSRNLARRYGEMQWYKKALDEATVALNNAIKYGYGHMFSTLVVATVYHEIELVNKEDFVKCNTLKRKLRQAYYIAAARNETCVQKIIKDYYYECFGESIVL